MSNEKTLDASQDENDPRIELLLRNRELPTPRPQIRAAVLKHARRNLPPQSAPRPAFLLRHRSALGAAAASLLIATSLYSWYLMAGNGASGPTATPHRFGVSVSSDRYLDELDAALDVLKQRIQGIRPTSTPGHSPATRASGTLLQHVRGMRLHLENRSGNVTNGK